MIEQVIRLYHCHKLRINVQIFEDYEIVNGVRTLMQCSCPHYMGISADGRTCNGLNDYNLPCGYSQYPSTK